MWVRMIASQAPCQTPHTIGGDCNGATITRPHKLGNPPRCAATRNLDRQAMKEFSFSPERSPFGRIRMREPKLIIYAPSVTARPYGDARGSPCDTPGMVEHFGCSRVEWVRK